MPHSPEEKKQALTRIRRIKGQERLLSKRSMQVRNALQFFSSLRPFVGQSTD